MFEGIGWKRKDPMEKRAFVDPKTGEPVAGLVRGEHGEVIGTAASTDEVHKVVEQDIEGMREAA